MKKKKIVLIIGMLLSINMSNANAFDLGQFMSDLFSSLSFAGSKNKEEDKKEEVKKDNKNNKDKVNDKEKIKSKPKVSEIDDKSILRQEKKCFSHYPWGPPQYMEEKQIDILYLCKKNFAIGYDVDKKNAIWVSEHVNDKNILTPKKVTNYNFDYDPQIPKKYQSNSNSYKRGGYDRGQLVASENMMYLDGDKEETYYFTNVVPQIGEGFNRGIWMELEMWTRQQVKHRGSLYITTGPLYLDKPIKKLDDGTYIPSHFYKIVVDYKISETISFVIPNKSIITENSDSNSKGYRCEDKGKEVCGLFDFSTSIKEVERLSGLKFLSGVSDNHVMKIKVSDDFVNPRRYLKSNFYKQN